MKHEAHGTPLLAALLLLLASQLTAQLPPVPAPPQLPFGFALTSEPALIFKTEPAHDSVAVLDADPASPNFGRVITRIDVGDRPAGIVASLDNADVLVANHADDTLSLIDVASLTVRKTLSSPELDGPWDITLGPREVITDLTQPGGPITVVTVAFGSGTYHAYVSDRDGIMVFESGPDGVAGLGFDDLIGNVPTSTLPPAFTPLNAPRGIVFDPQAPLDAFANTIGVYVADTTPEGFGVAIRVTYDSDLLIGEQLVDTTSTRPGFRSKRFAITQQYVSTHTGRGLDVALADAQLSVSKPELLYLSMSGGIVDVFVADTGHFVKRFHPGVDIHDLAPFLQP